MALDSLIFGRSECGAHQIRNANHFLHGQIENCLSIDHCCERATLYVPICTVCACGAQGIHTNVIQLLENMSEIEQEPRRPATVILYSWLHASPFFSVLTIPIRSPIFAHNRLI